MAEDNNKLGTKGLTDTIKKLRDDINESTDTGIGKDQFLKAQVKAELVETKLFEAEQAGDEARAAAIREQLTGVREALERGPMNINTLNKRMEELDAINQNLERAAERAEDQKRILESQIARDDTVNSLSQLNESLKAQTDSMETVTDAQKGIEKLQGFFGRTQTENSKILKEAFEEGQKNLQEAIESGNVEGQQLALAQLQAVKEGAESEEKRREAEKAQEEANDSLEKIAKGTENMANSFENFAGNIAGGAGFLAGIAGLALLFFDPEKFISIMTKTIQSITKILQDIVSVFRGEEGSVDNLLETIKNNFGVFAGLLGGLILVLGGPLLKGLSALVKVAQAVRSFVTLTWVPGMITMLSGMMSSFMAMLMNPVGLIVIGIAAAFALVGVALAKIRNAMGFTSIFDVIMLGLAHLKDAFGHLVNSIGGMVNFILGIVEKFGSFLGFEIELPEIPEMSTDNAARKRVELEEKAAQAELDKKNQEIKEQVEPQIVPPLPTTGDELQAANMENFDLSQLQNLGSKSSTNVVQQNSPSTANVVNTNIIERHSSDVSNLLAGFVPAR
tara:strand:- start:17534 stop:19222 length:1689 start_codon:yes stop_codon:yes gene_type:complete